MRYPLAPNPIFWTLQGEGHLRGFPMVFVRLAGCSVGCAECDTDYGVRERADEHEIASRARTQLPNGDRDWWLCVTGGEPTDHELRPLLGALKNEGFSTMLISSGKRRVIPPVDWLSISPHAKDPTLFQQRYGNELKLVDGLNGLNLDEFYEEWPDDKTDFMYRYVQPLWRGDPENGAEDRESLARCIAFIKQHPRWALSRQDHKHWGLA